MTYTESFVLMNNLQPADAILLKKKFMGMLNHFAVYLGREQETNRPVFAANYTNGVQVLRDQEVCQFLQTLEPEKIEKFRGTGMQRREAVERAISKIGQTSYNLIFNNCEHYKNFVQFGHKYSGQVETAGNVALIGGGVAAIAGAISGNKAALGIGLLALAFGALALGTENQND